MSEKGISLRKLAAGLGMTLAQARGFATGATVIDDVVAAGLARVLGGTAKVWLAREKLYRSGPKK